MDKAIKYLDRDELPVHWERATLFDLHIPDSDSDENYSDVSKKLLCLYPFMMMMVVVEF